MKKDPNAFIKILIILVIASLALLAIVYFMLLTSKDSGKISTPSQLIEKSTKLPSFADIDNYEFNTAKIYASHPVNCKYVDSDFAKLEKELNIEETGFLTYDYNGFRLQALENKYNWTKEDLEKIMDESSCSSSLFYGTIEDSKYLIFGRCLGTDRIASEAKDYEYLVGDCFMAEKDVYDYFGRPSIGGSIASILKGDDEFLNYDYYSYVPGNMIIIDRCKENGFTQEIDFANETKVSSLAVHSHYEEEYGIVLKIMPNSNWTESEAERMLNETTCGISDNFLGTIGANLLFASACPGAFNTDEEQKNNLCEERLAEIKEIMASR